MLSSLPWPTRNDANSQLASYLPRVLFLHEVRVHELDHVGQRAFLASLQSNGALDVDNVCVKERDLCACRLCALVADLQQLQHLFGGEIRY